MPQSDKQDKLLAVNKCIYEYRNYPYEFWLSQIGKSPLIANYSGAFDDRIYEIEIDPVWDDENQKTIRVMFTTWSGFMNIYGITSSILVKPDNDHLLL